MLCNNFDFVTIDVIGASPKYDGVKHIFEIQFLKLLKEIEFMVLKSTPGNFLLIDLIFLCHPDWAAPATDACLAFLLPSSAAPFWHLTAIK